MALKQLVFTKNCSAASSSREGFVPTPVCDNVWVTQFYPHTSCFWFMSSPYTATKFWFVAKHRPWLLIFQSTTSLFHKQFVPLSKIFDDVIACDLWFAPPSIKNPGTSMIAPALFMQWTMHSIFYLTNTQFFLFFASYGKQIALLLLYPNFVRRNKNQQDLDIHYCNALYFVKIV